MPGWCKHAEDRNHGVLLAGCSLLTALLEVNPSYIKEFRRYIPALVRALRSAMSVLGYVGLLQFKTETRKKNPRLLFLCLFTRPCPQLFFCWLSDYEICKGGCFQRTRSQTEKPHMSTTSSTPALGLVTRNMVTSGYTNAAEYDIAGASFLHTGNPLVEHHPYLDTDHSYHSYRVFWNQLLSEMLDEQGQKYQFLKSDDYESWRIRNQDHEDPLTLSHLPAAVCHMPYTD